MGLPNMNITARTTIGAKLVASAAYFQAGVAKLISSEGLKIQKASVAASNKRINPTQLRSIEDLVKDTTISLSNLEGAIIKKILAGSFIYNTPDW